MLINVGSFNSNHEPYDRELDLEPNGTQHMDLEDKEVLFELKHAPRKVRTPETCVVSPQVMNVLTYSLEYLIPSKHQGT